ncbi:MAG: sorbosone dehydrogenase [Bacteroidetes bacterium QS_7_67_15]|nr:MAG: sorbosone dehydrogenase [Bacteroidetes bacterium QS_7_67_15]
MRSQSTARSRFRYALFASFLIAAGLLLLAGCNSTPAADPPTAASDTTAAGDCPPGARADSLSLPDGFCAQVFHEGVGPARHLAVAPDGDVYVKLSETENGGGIVALRDTDDDGAADRTARFADFGGTGIEVHNDRLYASSDVAVKRWPLPSGDALAPGGAPQTIVSEFPDQGQHAAKSLALGAGGGLYVNVGAPSNACQQESRTKGSPGQDPCPLLKEYGGVWTYSANQTGQAHQPSARYASGIRNAVALDWNPRADSLYLVQHGRDQLHSLWPDRYTQKESAQLPSEEFFAVSEGDDFGWPYCYHDWKQNQKELAPEYGGDGQKVGRCSTFEGPVEAFPGHWAPNDLLFYTGSAFPQKYRGGAFIAFHGSWNRAPFPQQGYRVAFVPFEGGAPSADYTTFANHFARKDSLESPGDAAYRPMGLAQGPDGALYISDSQDGRLWRVTHP